MEFFSWRILPAQHPAYPIIAIYLCIYNLLTLATDFLSMALVLCRIVFHKDQLFTPCNKHVINWIWYNLCVISQNIWRFCVKPIKIDSMPFFLSHLFWNGWGYCNEIWWEMWSWSNFTYNQWLNFLLSLRGTHTWKGRCNFFLQNVPMWGKWLVLFEIDIICDIGWNMGK